LCKHGYVQRLIIHKAGSLDNISRRYAWFNRLLKTYDVEHVQVFPASWKVNEQLANAFCESTRDDFKGILHRTARQGDGRNMDVDLLLSSLQETLDFEHGLEKRFMPGVSHVVVLQPSYTNIFQSRTSLDSMMSGDERPHVFEQAISEAFGPYLSLWVEAQDRLDFLPALHGPLETDFYLVTWPCSLPSSRSNSYETRMRNFHPSLSSHPHLNSSSSIA